MQCQSAKVKDFNRWLTLILRICSTTPSLLPSLYSTLYFRASAILISKSHI